MTTAIKISLNIMFLVLGVLLTAQMLGLLPDGSKEKLKARIALSESVAVQCSLLANQMENQRTRMGRRAAREKYQNIKAVLAAFVDRNAEVISAGLRTDSGLKVIAGPHLESWNVDRSGKAAEHISVPIIRDDKDWGKVEICFTELRSGATVFGYSFAPLLLAIVSMTAAAGFGSMFYFSRMFNDSQKGAVPSRVRSALDTLSDGLLVLDNQEKVVFANRAFEEATGMKEKELLGRSVAELNWSGDWDEIVSADLDEEETRKLALRTEIGEVDFTIGISEVVNDKGDKQGLVVSFNDVTVLEKRREELLYTMRSLQNSRDMIKEQNEQLKVLATRDPLTNCWNRRSFFEEFNNLWKSSKKGDRPLSALMLDIDHFKAVNDNHGHAVGDDVLRQVAGTILEMVRAQDIVCRYGGEEFCVLLPETALPDAKEYAESFRKRIEKLKFDSLTVTVSQGVSCSTLRAAEPEELLEQADQALYVAKRTGRNRVVASNEVPADFDLKEAEDSSHTRHEPRPEKEETGDEESIPFQVVSSMISVLNHRDPATASHCMRVADLSFALGQGLMSASELYALEVGALLHDIGKIAVPDSILLKPERLTEEELQTLRKHSRIGCELIEAAFNSKSVIETVRYAGCPFGGSEKFPGMLKGPQIPLSSRIVTIADAFDSMVTDSVYRKKLTRDQAFAELYRCANTQFDPSLVERFVEIVRMRPESDDSFGAARKFSKDFALQLAYISEQITKSFDEQDFELLQANAKKLEAAANHHKNPKLKIIAAKLMNHSATDNDKEVEVEKIMNDVIELLELCQTAQREFLHPSKGQQA